MIIPCIPFFSQSPSHRSFLSHSPSSIPCLLYPLNSILPCLSLLLFLSHPHSHSSRPSHTLFTAFFSVSISSLYPLSPTPLYSFTSLTAASWSISFFSRLSHLIQNIIFFLFFILLHHTLTIFLPTSSIFPLPLALMISLFNVLSYSFRFSFALHHSYFATSPHSKLTFCHVPHCNLTFSPLLTLSFSLFIAMHLFTSFVTSVSLIIYPTPTLN